MKILAHRGVWKTYEERNQITALQTAIDLGFGIETDLRDLKNAIVVSHDPAIGECDTLESLLSAYQSSGSDEPLALNIKADGLVTLLKPILEKYSGTNYFCFDMSVPENVVYRREKIRFFTRESEYERSPLFYANAAGVWMDMFELEWIDPAQILRHLEAGKQVAVVSPELHKRQYRPFWGRLRDSGVTANENLMLCTDHPEEAKEYFHE